MFLIRTSLVTVNCNWRSTFSVNKQLIELNTVYFRGSFPRKLYVSKCVVGTKMFKFVTILKSKVLDSKPYVFKFVTKIASKRATALKE